ncbi:hypothetical protein K7432_000834 [Basidiobolus ranarum]|uniref:Tetratricopeptide repeat protein 21A/21B fifth ARM repeats domain-containing protein n=1 Tax=Basidiobolus ranarum TaxID=34480 RepID=A0ABR2X408_9FUNG
MVKSAKEYLAEAQAHLESNNLREAVTALSGLIKIADGFPIPLLSRCTCYIQLGDYENAIKDAVRVLKLKNVPTDENIAPKCTTAHSVALVRLAKAFKELGDVETCQELLDKKNQVEEGEDSQEFIEEILASLPKTSAKNVTKPAEITNGELSEAEKKAEAELCKQKGNEFFRKQEFSSAIVEYNKGVSLDPTNHILYSNLCQVYLRMDNLTEASRCADSCLALNPSWAKGYYRQGMVLMKQGKYEEALKSFNAARNKSDKRSEEIELAILEVSELISKNPKPSSNALSTASYLALLIVILAIIVGVVQYLI